ncbi:MAG: DUF3486 family protein [Planctomycetes bacterium]|nr:DUF3486 family protein [Planctomycetota bacterium]
MSKRRAHSSIDRLPKDLQETLRRMIIDNEYPFDFSGEQEGKPKYEDLVDYCRQAGHKVSRSAVGRYGRSIRVLARMKEAGVLAREVMSGLSDENASQTQKAVAEMLTAIVIETAANDDSLTPKQLRELACTVKDCTAIAIKSEQYVKSQIEKKAKAAVKKITEIAGKKQIDPETLKAIREQIYGIL